MNSKLNIVYVAPPPGRWRRSLRRWLKALGWGRTSPSPAPGPAREPPGRVRERPDTREAREGVAT